MVLRRGREHPDEVVTGEQPGDGDVAAEEVVHDREDPDAGQARHERGEHPGAVGAREHSRGTPILLTGGTGPGHVPGRPVPGSRCTLHPCEEPGAHPARGVAGGAAERALEGPGHPDPVLVLGEVVVGRGRGEVETGQQVVLVGGVGEAPSEHGEVRLLPPGHRVAHGAGLGDGVLAHLGLMRVAREPQRHDTQRRELRVSVEHGDQGVLEDRPVVHPGAHDHLPVHLDPAVEEDAQPPQARRTLRVPEHARPHLGVGGVDGHEERAEPLLQHPLGIELGEAGQRREVPVEKGQAVVVVLQVEAPAHPLGELVDEAERAVVVARPDPVEHRGLDCDPERLADGLGDPELELAA